MADFPTTIYEERVTENLPGLVYDPTDKKNLYSEDFQHHAEEIIAIENVLGTSPVGFFTTIKNFLWSLFTVGMDFVGSTSFTAPADSTTYYAGMSGWAGGTNQSYYNFPFQADKGKILHVTVRIGRSGTVPTSEYVALYLRVGSTDYLISNTIDLARFALSSYQLNDQEIKLEAGDNICIKMVTPAWVTNPGSIVLQSFIHIQATP